MTQVEILDQLMVEAKKCVNESEKESPKVAAAAVLADGTVIFAHRGENSPGNHAEFTLLQEKLKDITIAGSEIYATLEPCTMRGSEKIPCAERLVYRKVKRVWIGMVDPNPAIKGNGIQALRKAGIDVQFFPVEYSNQVEEMNWPFIRSQAGVPANLGERQETARLIQHRSLDDWYVQLNRLYWNRNFQKSPSEILAHLVEVVGALSHLASNKKKDGITADIYIPKAIAWWIALCGKLGVKSVSSMVWAKFPGVCTYCMSSPHKDAECREFKKSNKTAPWELLRQIGAKSEKPFDLSKWQTMFDDIYPTTQTESYGPTFARLSEELGELAEAVRIFPAEPGYFLSEASDVFAWLMHLANVHETVTEVPFKDRGTKLGYRMALAYPEGCVDCGNRICTCAPILLSTIGRIAHEVPPDISGYGEGGSFLTPNQVRAKFQTL